MRFLHSEVANEQGGMSYLGNTTCIGYKEIQEMNAINAYLIRN